MSDHDDLTPDERSAAKKIFEGTAENGQVACFFCAGIHDTVAKLEPWRQPCPRIKRVVWHPDGSLIEVEYWESPINWQDDVIYPRHVYDAESTDEKLLTS